MRGSQDKTFLRRIVELIFYGNYFYGVCAVCLMIETAVRFSLPYNDSMLYLITFTATVLFYNYPYARNYSSKSNDERSQWYRLHRRMLIKTQIVLSIILLFSLSLFVNVYYLLLVQMSILQWVLVLIFPVTGVAYYGANWLTANHNLRKAGFLKPFVIGFVWAGVVLVYPLLFNDLRYNYNDELTLPEVLMFLKNFMFISLLAVMFDIKDHADDSDTGLRTFVVRLGLSKTIFLLVLPLTLLGILTFLSYAVTHHFTMRRILLLLMPFLLLTVAAISFRKKRSVLYSVIVIDGLMLVKAFFDILAMLV